MWPFSRKRRAEEDGRGAGQRERPVDVLGVREVDWASYTHAYGAADDVPDQILDLLDADESIRENALWNLFGNIHHQGTVYDASRYAVPFLLRIVADKNVKGRENVIQLLTCLALGTSYHDVHRDMIGADEIPADELESLITEELTHVRACRDWVVDGLDIYRELLKDPDPSVRISVGFLIAQLGEDGHGLREEIVETLVADTDQEVVASLLLSASILGMDLEAWNIVAKRVADTGQDSEIVKLSIALGNAFIAGEQTPDYLVEALVESLDSPPELEHSIHEVTWFECGIQRIIIEYLARTGRERLERYVDPLLAMLDSDHRFEAEGLIAMLLDIAFGEGKYGGNPSDLTALQKRVIVALYDCHRVILRYISPHSYDSAACAILLKYELPSPNTDEFETLVAKCRK